MMEAVKRLTQPDRAMVAAVKRLIQPSEEVDRARAELEKLTQPLEEMRLAMDEAVKRLTQPLEEGRSADGGVGKANPAVGGDTPSDSGGASIPGTPRKMTE